MKNEGPYLKEWLDYHLLADVEHFYLYDNESTDNQYEVAKPYVEAGLVDYFPFPGLKKQASAYKDAVKRFKFFSRYMAIIDSDEFIYPKLCVGGAEVVDEILSHDPNAAGLAINWHLFGSNEQEKADYSRGVMEQFTRRAPENCEPIIKWNSAVKTIANPRAIERCGHPHYATYFEGLYAVNENGGIVIGPYNMPVTAKKIVLNHYYFKSEEEFIKRKLEQKNSRFG